MFGSVGQVGSRALFDDVNLTDVSGFPLMLMPSVKVKLSPNPASQYLKIELAAMWKTVILKYMMPRQSLIRQYPLNGKSDRSV